MKTEDLTTQKISKIYEAARIIDEVFEDLGEEIEAFIIDITIKEPDEKIKFKILRNL